MYVIAEIGSNWKTLKQADDSVREAAAAGADAVKFQCFTHEKLYGYSGDLRGGVSYRFARDLSKTARGCGLDFILSVFDEKDVRLLDGCVDRWKIASSHNTHIPMIEAMARTDKPLIMSCGASTRRDIDVAVQAIKNIRKDDHDLTLMYCVSSYPSTDHDMQGISALRIEFGLPVGLSDHSTDVFNCPAIAKEVFGCPVLEKHFKICEDMSTADAPHSLSSWDFRRMVDRLNLGAPTRISHPISEEHFFEKHNVRLVVTQGIEPGDKFEYGKNYGIYRVKHPSDGHIPAYRFRDLDGLGSVVKLNIGDAVMGEHAAGFFT